ncbi:Thaumatin-like protein 1 [Heracleum sosnowskyi]|uniref:Thaumatin-like protein 1 n=1 Tax=Heracleum sosnowskyi TaxID=360622 RepID=A0AAD8MX43_9APIA|nr:Thaumatin-like protein 1 [Heracleum sosnowskyi]
MLLLRSLIFISLLTLHISATSITLYNKCSHPVWPGIQPGAGKPVLASHGCAFDAHGRGKCATGDCGGALFCNGIGGAPPATLAEITLGSDQDFYDVSLVDGYNLAISITPIKGTGKCTYAGCVSDLNMYCCTGSYGSPQSCKPTAYSRIFKNACPRAYSYAYDDPTSIATCTGGSYFLTFCPHH